jgi:hypothetical protein
MLGSSDRNLTFFNSVDLLLNGIQFILLFQPICPLVSLLLRIFIAPFVKLNYNEVDKSLGSGLAARARISTCLDRLDSRCRMCRC